MGCFFFAACRRLLASWRFAKVTYADMWTNPGWLFCCGVWCGLLYESSRIMEWWSDGSRVTIVKRSRK